MNDDYDLLMRHLSPTQRRSFKRADRFYVRGNHSGDRYLIEDDEITRLRDGHKFCLLTQDEYGLELPYYDSLLGKKILITCNEQLFLQTANDLSVRERGDAS